MLTPYLTAPKALASGPADTSLLVFHCHDRGPDVDGLMQDVVPTGPACVRTALHNRMWRHFRL